MRVLQTKKNICSKVNVFRFSLSTIKTKLRKRNRLLMEFGKVQEIDLVDFALPRDHPNNNNFFLTQRSNAAQKKKLYIGCTGWSMKEWIGTTYPEKAKTKDFLQYYGHQFNTIELNTTHYRIPTLDMITQWKKDTPDDFRFCPKLTNTISHSKDLGINSVQLSLFCDTVRQLEYKLGCCFLQFPPHFDERRLSLLEAFVQQFPKDIPLAFELRHESWFNTSKSFELLLSICQQNSISLVITDVAGRRDVLHMALTCSKVLIRFVGNGLHPTDYERIDDWITRMKSWFAQGVEEIYFFVHEPDNILSPELALYLYNKANEELLVDTRGPKLLNAPTKGQISLF